MGEGERHRPSGPQIGCGSGEGGEQARDPSSKEGCRGWGCRNPGYGQWRWRSVSAPTLGPGARTLQREPDLLWPTIRTELKMQHLPSPP